MKKFKIGILASPSLSGGNNVIFEHVSHIFERGNVDVCLIFPEEVSSADLNWFPKIVNVPRYSFQQAEKMIFDVLIATFWRSCYQLNQFDAKTYLYFNQSVESRFYPESDFNTRFFAESAYLLGLPVITEANWIKDYIWNNYQTHCELVLNGINKDNYSPRGKNKEEKKEGTLRVLIEGNVTSPFKNVANTVKICSQSEADEIWLLTNSKIESYPGVDRVFSNVPVAETQEIYRSCDVLVKLSTIEGMFGPPLEMFHCGGTAITYDVTGHEEYMIHDYNGFVVAMHQEDKVLEFINVLKNNPIKLNELKKNALITAANWYNWNDASQKFEQVILNSLSKPGISRTALISKTELLRSWYMKTNEIIVENDQNKRKLGLKIHNKLKSALRKGK